MSTCIEMCVCVCECECVSVRSVTLLSIKGDFEFLIKTNFRRAPFGICRGKYFGPRDGVGEI